MSRRYPLTIASLLLLLSGLAGQSTLSVPSQYGTIQAAIAAAVSGDTVLVAPGIYLENLNPMGKAITLRGSQGAAMTTVDGGGLGPALSVLAGEGPQTVIEGLRFTNGIGFPIPTPSGGIRAGGGVYVVNSSPTIRDCLIEGNQATRGGGVDCSGAAFFQRCEIRGNVASEAGGGVTVLPGGAPIFENCRIVANVASKSGGGLWFESANGAAMVGCLIAGNNVPGPTLRGTSRRGGGVFLRNGGSVVFSSCSIVGNASSRDGGIASDGSLAGVIVRNCIVWHNSGQAIVGSSLGAPATVSYSLIAGGYAGTGNGAQAPIFVDRLGGDWHLRPDSPGVNAGSSTAFFLAATDIDGEPRNLFGAVDIGCDEVADVAAAGALAGTVGLAAGNLEDVLLINGSAGGAYRRVEQQVGAGSSVTLLQPGLATSPAQFAIFGFLAEPTSNDFVNLGSGIGEMAFTPHVLIPWAYPLVFTYTHSAGAINGALVSSGPAPWYSGTNSAIPWPLTVSFQAIVEETAGQLRASNCVILVVH
ncbi:MAG: right-handed parallel beta-helix repeat-containing protein [Planctomycetes bacterium]|nr:right-handed parallel beta-helix repeat-containing protein [Planctomycetota bacterium]